MIKNDFKKTVGKNDFEVVFKKADGTVRTLTGTINPKKIETLTGVSVTSRKKAIKNDDILAVYDLDKNAFRSLTLAKVKKLKVLQAV